MNLLSKFEEYMYFDIYIVAIFKAWQVIITGKCLTILIQWMDVNISLPSNYTEGNFSMYLKHFTLILGKIILDKKFKFFPSITIHKVHLTMKQASKHIPWIKLHQWNFSQGLNDLTTWAMYSVHDCVASTNLKINPRMLFNHMNEN